MTDSVPVPSWGRLAPFLLAFVIAAPVGADSVVVFNELQYNPSGPSEDGEWLELHNQMGIDVDLSGWRLDDGIEFTFPPDTVIPAGRYLVVAKDPGNPALAGAGMVLGPYEGFLSNAGEQIDLLSSAGRLMDRIDYGDSGEWPVAADGSGVTLAKRKPGLPTGKSSRWVASAQVGGTPGALNFAEPGDLIRHTLVAPDATWKFDDSGAAPAGTWRTLAFNDTAWSDGRALFGTEAGGGPPVLTVTQHLVERFRAADIAGATQGQTLTTWNDTATGDGAAQHATAGGNPTYQANATPSGEPAVRFDGNDEFRTALSPGISGASGFLYIAVVRATSPPSGGSVTDGSGPYLWDREHAAAGDPLASLKNDGGRFGFQKRHDDGSGLGGPVSSSPISTSDFQIVAIRRNTSQSRFELWVDGVMESSTGDSGAALTPQPIVIGRHATNTNGGFAGDIAELLIYDDELTDSEFEAVGAYLESRYGLDTAYPGSAVATSISPTAGTTYFRQRFAFSGDPSRTVLRLASTVADGAVFYLNGTEIHRENLPGGAVSHGTEAPSDVLEPASSGFLPVSSSALLNGENVLAVSLHTAAGSETAAFAASLEGTETPPDPSAGAALVLNEVAGAGDAAFFVEIANAGTSTVSTAGYVLAVEGSAPASIPLPVTDLPPGGLLQLTEAQLGQRPFSGDKLFLRTPGGAGVADAREVTNRLRGRSAQFPDQWIFPDAPTPGAANSFSFESDVVINEICYHAPILPATPGMPPVIDSVQVIAPNAVWRYNEAGEIYDATWAQVAHPVGGNWESGPAILGSDTGFPQAIATQLTPPPNNVPYVVTYYFETDFTLNAQQAAALEALELTHTIDDGAVFYLNGVEIHRFNMPLGEVDATTFAEPGVDVAVPHTDTMPLPPGTAVAGSNRLSIEVHQNSFSSGDVIFGLEVRAPFVIDPGVPALPPRPSEEQWLELYNRGNSPVDLSGWNFGEGIDLTFPPGTVLDSGAYLVVAKDPGALLAAHPGIEVVGPYSGSLSRSGETLILRDAFNNPADAVRYCDGGEWPGDADGQVSTLELRDPDADNALPGAWAASDELARTSWQTYTYRGVAAPSAVGPDSQWREFVLGLHEEGELLIDDLRVTESPDGAAIPMLSDGSFESGNLNAWRALGNHRHVAIVPDPDGGGNVLHLRATGSTEHMHNHLETTLAGGRSVVNGREYEISFRARWLKGCRLLHTRLYFNRLPMTAELERPAAIGTPGAPNSQAETNAGPTSWGLTHFPVVPAAGEPVTVSVNVSDPDGIGALTLHYAVNGGAFQQTLMSAGGAGGAHEGLIPGQSAGLAVQFYVEAVDGLGAVSLIPAGGPQSRAMYEVEDGRAATTGIHNFRIVMTPQDTAWMHTPINVMSNDRLPCTVINNESEIYYNAGVRIKGSERARNQPSRVGFNVGFPKDNLFRGVHRTVAIDRSEGQVVGQRELLFDLMATSSRGVPGEFNDLCYVISPNPTHTSAAILQLARYGNVFLESQFDNGDEGTVYEYELVYYPLTADANGYKIPEPDSVTGVSITSLGDNPESYRWSYLIKNNQEYDDFSGVIAMVKQFDLSGGLFNRSVEEVLDVDQWLRALAYSCAAGAGDSYFSNSRHNGQFYARPDGRMLYFPHDMDFAFNASRSIFENNELQELTVEVSRKRAYLGHLHDICTTVFNAAWMAPWASHFDDLVPGGDVFNDDVSYINSRSNYILSQIDSQVAPVPFSIATNGGADFSTASSPVSLNGFGWVNVREIRLTGSSSPLPARWTALDRWLVTVPLSPGPNLLSFEAVDFAGNVVGTDSITVTSTAASSQPARDNLVVSEIYFNPPGSDESTEYLELLNISPSTTLDLTGLSFTDGVQFTFGSVTDLPPGERILLVANQPAFEAEFGTGLPVAGAYSGQLDNGGETLALTRADGTPVQVFPYDDEPPWPTAADGDGFSLVLVDPFSAPDHSLPQSWRASAFPGGSPGGTDTIDYDSWKAGFGNPGDLDDPDGDQLTVLDEWFFGGSPNVPEVLGPRYSFSFDTMTMEITVTRRAEAANSAVHVQTAPDLLDWSPAAGVLLLSNERLPGSSPPVDLLTLRVPLSAAPEFFRLAFGP